jgi:hypothetical protein
MASSRSFFACDKIDAPGETVRLVSWIVAQIAVARVMIEAANLGC